jgi:hypothetical protein
MGRVTFEEARVLVYLLLEPGWNPSKRELRISRNGYESKEFFLVITGEGVQSEAAILEAHLVEKKTGEYKKVAMLSTELDSFMAGFTPVVDESESTAG